MDVNNQRSTLLAAIDRDELVELTRLLSVTPSQCGIDPEGDCARILQDVLEGAGIETELRFVEPDRPNLVAVIPGRDRSRTLAFNGHLDTSPMSSDWALGHEAHFTETHLRAHGARNMKGGLAAMVGAAVALQRTGVQPAVDLWITAVMGHHDGAVGTLELLKEGMRPDYAILPEPTDLAIRTKQAGSLTIRVELWGRSGPAGGEDIFRKYASVEDTPIDAIEALPELLTLLRDTAWSVEHDPELPDLPLTQIRQTMGGYGAAHKAVAYTPDHVTAILAVWTAPGQTEESVLADVRAAVAPLLASRPGLRAEIEVQPSPSGVRMRNPLSVSLDSPVVTSLARGHEEALGREPVIGAPLPHSYFGCDAQVLDAHGVEAVSYGPASHGYRRDLRGLVRLDAIAECARALTLTAAEFGEG